MLNFLIGFVCGCVAFFLGEYFLLPKIYEKLQERYGWKKWVKKMKI